MKNFLKTAAWLLLFGMFFSQVGNAAPWTQSKQNANFLIFSDIHFDPYASGLASKLAKASVDEWEGLLNASAPSTMSPYDKDTNTTLLLSTLKAAKNTGLSFDYVLVTGDMVSHHFKDEFKKQVGGGEQDYQSFVLKTIVYVSRTVQKAFASKPVYFCLGNNDSDWDDYGGLIPGSGLLPGLAQEWKTTSSDTGDFLKGGYYVAPHPTLAKHEFIVLNDVFWSLKYTPHAGVGPYEKEEFAWLSQKLADAKAQGLKVTLISHMPPGMHARNASEHEDRQKPQKSFYKQEYLADFLSLIAQYRSVIDLQFCGHTHMDDFRVIRDSRKSPVLLTHISPAVSPVHHNNPGFQVMLYDKKTGVMKDMATFYLKNLLTASTQEPAQWDLEYTFREAYGYPAYNFVSLSKLADDIEKDETVRGKYVRYVPVSCTDAPPINNSNWKFFSCAHTIVNPSAYANCYR